MADYKSLAREYVLSDDPTRQLEITKVVATKLSKSPNHCGEWVQSVSPWISSNSQDGEEVDDFVSRAKALDFLATVLEQLETDTPVLSKQQVNLLVNFFASMFKNDHKAGVVPATKALSSLKSMANSSPSHAIDIIASIASIGDQFRNQPQKARLAIYKTVRAVLLDEKALAALQDHHGTGAQFLLDLSKAFDVERDPLCLMEWFGILKVFLASYTIDDQTAKDIFAIFSRFFPITIRASQNQSAVTADDLKQELRNCFAANQNLAHLSIPFLLGKMNQGEGLTQSVKIDILRTLDACLASYDDATTAIAPHAHEVWKSLKHEVRKGEDQEVVALALKTTHTLSAKLTGEESKRFLATVLADCLEDLSSETHAQAAGKLLMTTMSTKPDAFSELTPKIIAHTRSVLQQNATITHKSDLIGVLNSILEVRVTLIRGNSSSTERQISGVSQETLYSLYDSIYKPLIELHVRKGANVDDVQIGKQALRGLGLLVRQPALESTDSSALMANEETCIAVCSMFSQIIAGNSTNQEELFGKLVDQITVTFAEVTQVLPSGIQILTGMVLPHHSTSAIDKESFEAILSKLVFIGCTKIPNHGDGLGAFVNTVSEFLRVLTSTTEIDKSHIILRSILNAMVHFKKTCLAGKPAVDFPSWRNVNEVDGFVKARYSVLYDLMHSKQESDIDEPPLPTNDQVEHSFAAVCLWMSKELIRRNTALRIDGDTAAISVSLNQVTDNNSHRGPEATKQYIDALARIAYISFQNLNKDCQQRFNLGEELLLFFCGHEEVGVSEGTLAHQLNGQSARAIVLNPDLPKQAYGITDPPRLGLKLGDAARISASISDALSLDAVNAIFENQIGDVLFISGLLDQNNADILETDNSVRILLANLANKCQFESKGKLLEIVESQMTFAASEDQIPEGASGQAQSYDDYRAVLSANVAAVVGGMMRRMKKSHLNGLLTTMRNSPAHSRIGHKLARTLEFIAAPLIKEDSSHIVLPTWRSRLYHQLISPMVELALPKPEEGASQTIVCSNYRIATVLLLRWMEFRVYEDSAAKILRICLCAARDLEMTTEGACALRIILDIIRNSPNSAADFINSIVEICRNSISYQTTQQRERSSWMPDGYLRGENSSDAIATSKQLALELFQLLPSQYQAGQLRPVASQVKRTLSEACGSHSRMLRVAARRARKSWTEIN